MLTKSTPAIHAHHQAMYLAKQAFAQTDYAEAYAQLERAHILGQFEFLPHWNSHWWMLRVAKAMNDQQETTGQVRRLLAVIPGFLFGWVPVGNNGRASVSAIKPMPLSADLAALMQGYIVRRSIAARLLILLLGCVFASLTQFLS